jgi:hypothetical protein
MAIFNSYGKLPEGRNLMRFLDGFLDRDMREHISSTIEICIIYRKTWGTSLLDEMMGSK